MTEPFHCLSRTQFIHNQDWESAMRIAEQYDPASVSEVLTAQAKAAVERKQFTSAESLFLQAKRPELALKMFREQRMWHDALRIAEDYLPGKVNEIQAELNSGEESMKMHHVLYLFSDSCPTFMIIHQVEISAPVLDPRVEPMPLSQRHASLSKATTLLVPSRLTCPSPRPTRVTLTSSSSAGFRLLTWQRAIRGTG